MALRRAVALLLRGRETQVSAAADSLAAGLHRAAAGPALHRAGSRERIDPCWQELSLRAVAWGSTLAGAAMLATPSTAACAPATEAPPKTGDIDLSKAGMHPLPAQRTIVFVLGGPGSGKGTQCAKLVKEFGVQHLSAGDLLREHMKSGTPDGNMVADMIKQGQIVPSHVTISLLEKAMTESGKDSFLIDGFPRNEENRAAFEKQTRTEPNFILFFDCPEEVMTKRLLGRNEGRTDDNVETIKKRFKVFLDSSMPVVQHYESTGKVHRFKADRDPDAIYGDVRKLFLSSS